MARKNTPKHGSLNLVGTRYYYKVKLPGTGQRKTYPLIAAGQSHSTSDRRMAIALANELWERAESTSSLEESDTEYDGTIPRLVEIYLEAHSKEIIDKDPEVRDKEIRFYKSALADLVEFLKSVRFSMDTYELKPNRIVLWRKSMNTDKKVCRTTINKKVNAVKQMIHYAVIRELEPASVYYSIDTIKPIKKGQDNFKDYEEIGPIEWDKVVLIFPYLDTMIRDMLLVMRYTGARPGEIRLMRPCDIDQTDSKAWVYTLERHKTRRHGIKRNIIIGPSAQPILLKYLVRPGQMYCFPPRGNNQKNEGGHYTSGSFAKIITRAVAIYNAAHPKTPVQFHANQLRHSFATQVCMELGIEVARCAMGHTTTQMTKRYARKALEVEQLKNAKQASVKFG